MSIKPEELKPCPFCGGPADYGRGGRYAYNYYVICQKCGAQCLGSAFQNDAFNARSWNTRTIPDTHRVVSVELLERLLQENYLRPDESDACIELVAIIDDKQIMLHNQQEKNDGRITSKA